MTKRSSLDLQTENMPDDVYQRYILSKVARTFALTIPQLPVMLREVVSNAYLLCRISDTIEDETALSAAQKLQCSRMFIEVVQGNACAEAFAATVYPLLSTAMTAAERDLVKHAARIIRLLQTFPDERQQVVQRCVSVMASGMAYFQLHRPSSGVADLEQLSRYCYYVAGVVGEMLTELCSQYCAEMGARKPEMLRLAVAFGRGLQMTNILKDIREDYARGVCWLPQDLFSEYGCDLTQLSNPACQPAFVQGLEKLIAIAHADLCAGLKYTLYIPKHERGLRKFCLWAIGMALLTLRKVHARPDFKTGHEVKIKKVSVLMTLTTGKICAGRDATLEKLFAWVARDLPQPLQIHSDDKQLSVWRNIVTHLPRAL